MPKNQSEELRLALVMNGGVSLAVWMGGVTNEIFRLVKETHPVYQQLLDLTRTRARVDVMSGTSAGGINAAALSLAMLYDGDFSMLRDVWLDTGNLGELLRDPLARNPGSLLQGDERFLAALEDAFERLTARNERPVDPHTTPIDLRLSTTLLEGIERHTLDDLGTPVMDVDHRASFRFEHADTHTSFGDKKTLIKALARAARSTASFPFAFEPSLFAATRTSRSQEAKPAAANPAPAPGGSLEDAAGHNISFADRYLVDGGILDNKPFRNALRSIFNMKANHSVRRVLVYVNPDASGGAATAPLPQDADQPSRPSLASVLASSIVGIPQAQAITDQLAYLREHNETVRTRRDSLLNLVLSFKPTQTETLAGTLFPIYRMRRIGDAFDAIFADLQATHALAESGTGLPALGKRQREWLHGAFMAMFEPEDMPSDAGEGWIPRTWPVGAHAPQNLRDSWEWGLFPVEFAARVALDMLRRVQRLMDDAPESPTRNSTAGGGAADPPGAAPPPDWQDPDRPRPRSELAEGDELAARLGLCWDYAYQLIDAIEEQRREEKAHWSTGAAALLPRLEDGRAALVTRLFPEILALVRETSRRQRCGARAVDFANILIYALPLAREVAQAASRSELPRKRDDARSLAGICDYFDAAQGMDKAAHLRALIHRILQLEVIEYSFTDHDELGTDAIIELAQISGNSASPLGGKCRATQKLTGLQLAHFAAFYKRSWRANDWTYGRLDGAERLVKILLNPERLHRYYFRRPDAALARISAIAWEGVESPLLRDILKRRWDWSKRAIVAELAFLGEVAPRFPETLARCADAVTARLHYGILREELPTLRDAVLEDQAFGAEAGGAGQSLVVSLAARTGRSAAAATPFGPEAAVERLKAGLLGGERMVAEAGSDLFTRTVTHALASFQSAVASQNSHLGPVAALFAMLKLPIMALHLLSVAIVRSSRTGAAILAVILALGCCLVAIQFFFTAAELGKPGSNVRALVSFGWMLLALGMFFPLARTPISTLLWLCALGIGAALYVKGALLVVAVLFVLIVMWRVGWGLLQILAGLIGLGLAALWGSGELDSTILALDGALHDWLGLTAPQTMHLPSWTQQPVVLTAGLIGLGLLLALWQVSPASRGLERLLRLAARRVADLARTLCARGRQGP